MFLENHLELLALYGGCGYGGLTLFGVNTGLRGDTLAGVLDQSRARRPGRRSAPVARGGAHPVTAEARGAGEHPGAPDAGRGVRCHRPRGRADQRGRSGRAVARRARGRRRSDGAADGDLHLGHHGAAQGHQQQPLQAPRHRHGGVEQPGARHGRHRLRLHAALPLQRHLPRLPARPARLRRRSRCASASARRASCPTCSATASPSGTTWASRCTTCWARSRSSTAATSPASTPR